MVSNSGQAEAEVPDGNSNAGNLGYAESGVKKPISHTVSRDATSEGTRSDGGDSTTCLCKLTQVSAVVPRRKFDIDVFPCRLVLKTKSATFLVPYRSIDGLYALPVANKVMVSVMISLKAALTMGKQRVSNLVFSFMHKDRLSVEYNSDTIEGLRWRVFADVLARASSVTLHEPGASTATADDDASTPAPPPTFATMSINEGHLFFFDQHCIFVDKPPMRLAYNDLVEFALHRIRFGSRFDIVLAVRGSKRAISFRNVDMAIFDQLESFIKQKCANVKIVDSSIDAGGDDDEDEDLDE